MPEFMSKSFEIIAIFSQSITRNTRMKSVMLVREKTLHVNPPALQIKFCLYWSTGH